MGLGLSGIWILEYEGALQVSRDHFRRVLCHRVGGDWHVDTRRGE